MDSTREAEAAVECDSILHPLSSLEWIDCTCTKPPLLFDKIHAVYVPQQSTLYVSTRDSELYFCNGPFDGPKIAWKGPHNFPRKQKIEKYALAVYCSDLAIVGGRSQETGCSTDQVWLLHSAQSSAQAELLPSKMLTKRQSVVAVGNEAYLAVTGGISDRAEFIIDVEVYNGTRWIKVKSLPKELRKVASVLHSGVWYLIEEVDQNEAGATYSASLKELVSSQDTEWQMLDRCSSGEMLVAPVSFDDQLLAIKKKCPSGYGIHMLSPKTRYWVIIAPLPCLECADRIQYASMIGLPEKQLMMVYVTIGSTVKIATIKGIDFIKEEKISLTSLMKLEHGYNVPVLSSLKGDRLWKLKDKAVFDLKFNERNGCDEPAVNLYISSWLEDKDAGCPPTWNNLVVLLREVDLEEIAKNVLAIVASNNLILLSDLRITADTGVKALLNVQSQLGYLYISGHDTSAQHLVKQIQHHCHIVMWKQKEMKRKLKKMNGQLLSYKRYTECPSAPTVKQPRITLQRRDHQEPKLEADQPRMPSASDRPELHKLDLIEGKGKKVKLIERVAAKWEAVATRLYFEGSDIERIKRDCNHQSVHCCRTVFIEWTDGRGRKPVTWEELIKAINEADFSEVAKDLQFILDI